MDDELILMPDEDAGDAVPTLKSHPWQVAIIDDEPDVHAITKMVLGGVKFRDRSIEFFDAYSAAEGRRLMADVPGIAVVFLDVVMESDRAGLDLAVSIREELGNADVRIVLRTGQPGQAPEKDIIVKYDINDYKHKTELSATRLFTTLIAALRSYQDLVTIGNSRKGLQDILQGTAELFRKKSVTQFLSGVLMQMNAIFHLGSDALLYARRLSPGADDEKVVAACGKYDSCLGHATSSDAVPAAVRNAIAAAMAKKASVYQRDHFSIYFPCGELHEIVIHVDAGRQLDALDVEMIDIFCANVAVGLANVNLLETLESTVTRRTKDLAQTNAHLKIKGDEQQLLIKQLQDTQAQLLHSEKMASIGQLAAGVAHEINNPVAFVSSNMRALGTYVDSLLKTIDGYERAFGMLPASPGATELMAQVKKEVDLDFLKEDVTELLKESADGLNRVKDIVQSLTDYSHVGESDWVVADLHRELDSTLNIAANAFRHKATIVKEYGVLPRVKCLASQLNQVFMNLIVNATEAIEETGVITIRTGCENDWVWIEIGDNGVGIPAENLTRVFDPFFTTKPVGKGTGLGLSLSYNIIAKHGGRIEVGSEPGKGTRFTLHLPVAVDAQGDYANHHPPDRA